MCNGSVDEKIWIKEQKMTLLKDLKEMLEMISRTCMFGEPGIMERL